MEKALGKFFLGIFKWGALLSISTVGWGLCTFKFWYWFILPVFSAAPLITFSQAIGLSLFSMLFNKTISPDLKPELYDSDKNTRLFISVIAPYYILGITWLIKVLFL